MAPSRTRVGALGKVGNGMLNWLVKVCLGKVFVNFK